MGNAFRRTCIVCYTPLMSKVSAKGSARAEISAERARARDAASLKRGRTGDSYQNFEAKIGLKTGNISDGGTYGFNPITRERTLLEWIHRGNWLAGLAVDLIPDDMTRAGVELLGNVPQDQAERIEELATTLNIWQSLRDNDAWGRLYGGSIAVHMVKGQDYSTPMRLETIGKDQYKGLLVLDRWMVEPSMEDLVTEEGPSMGLPKYYRVTAQAPGLRNMRIHYTRAIRVEGNRLPYWQRLTENLWGQSIIERLYDRILAFDSATQGASQLILKSWLRTYKIKDLRAALTMGGDAANGIVQMVHHMARFQSIEGITLIDAEDEFEAHQNTSMSGMAEMLIHLGQQISGGFQIPLVRLFGQSPVGLNSTGDSDIKTYYENINNAQNKKYKVPVTTIYRALAQSAGVKLPPGFGIQFRPLWLLEEGERADIAEKIMRTASNGIESGVLTQRAAMEEVRESSRTTGFGGKITDDDIANASEDLPPIPVEVAEISAQAKEETANEAPPAKKAA